MRGSESVLIVRAGQQSCAVPILHLVETMRPLPIRGVSARSPVLGVAIVRGAPTVVLDAASLFGQVGSPTRFVTLRVAERVIALAVDAVVGVRQMPRQTLTTLPPLLARYEALDSLATIDNELVVLLQTSRLVSEELLRELEAAS